MKCYIYKIVNNITGQVYVGQTTNFSRRKQEHLDKLRNNKHINQKLQSSWNKYGENNFSWQYKSYDMTKEELDKQEILEIKLEDSYNNGFNLTEGGTGGDTRGKLSAADFFEIYLGNVKYDGLCNRTAKAYNCDSSTVSSIKRNKAYDKYKTALEKMPKEEKDRCLKNFENKLGLDVRPPKPIKKKLSDQDVITLLCLVSCFGRGTEAAFLRQNNLSKGLVFHIKKGEYIDAQKKFSCLSDDEISKIANNYFNSNNLQSFCKQKIIKYNKVQRPSWIAH